MKMLYTSGSTYLVAELSTHCCFADKQHWRELKELTHKIDSKTSRWHFLSQTDRRIDRRTDRRTDRHTDRRTDRHKQWESEWI